jgi:hypothetical protein
VGDHGSFVNSGGSPEAEAFLRMANHALEHAALQKEIDEALATRDEAEKLKFGLDREDAHLRGARISFDREVQDTFVDPEVFWSAFEPLDDQRKFALLKRLRDTPAAFVDELAAAPAPDSGIGGGRSPGLVSEGCRATPRKKPDSAHLPAEHRHRGRRPAHRWRGRAVRGRRVRPHSGLRPRGPIARPTRNGSADRSARSAQRTHRIDRRRGRSAPSLSALRWAGPPPPMNCSRRTVVSTRWASSG